MDRTDVGAAGVSEEKERHLTFGRGGEVVGLQGSVGERDRRLLERLRKDSTSVPEIVGPGDRCVAGRAASGEDRQSGRAGGTKKERAARDQLST